MNDDNTIKIAYGSIDLPEPDMYSAVKSRLVAPNHHRRMRLKPTVLIIIILAFALSITTIAVPVITNLADLYFLPVINEDGEYTGPNYPSFTTVDGDVIHPIDELFYALEQLALKGDDNLFYTIDQMDEWFKNGMAQQNTEVRQSHMQPEENYTMEYGISETGVIYGVDEDGVIWTFNAPPGFCNNTYFFPYEGRRVCSSCGYVFSLEQDREIGLIE